MHPPDDISGIHSIDSDRQILDLSVEHAQSSGLYIKVLPDALQGQCCAGGDLLSAG